MTPLADLHCHLLAGLDDGPPTEEVADAMCRLAYEDGTRFVAAVAHQNERWDAVTPERIREAGAHLKKRLREMKLDLAIYPTAEVMVQPDTEDSWQQGRLVSVGDRRQYLLIEMPEGLFVDLADTIANLRQNGVRPILAHPERHEELLHEDGQIERLIDAGCLVQVSSSSVASPKNRADAQALKSWFQRGIVHCLGSDGHSLRSRPPLMGAAYRQIVRWIGRSEADRICSTVGASILQGLPLWVPAPQPRRRSWTALFW